MSSRFSIEGSISMVDKATKTMGKVARNATGFSTKMQRQFARADSSVGRVGRTLKQTGKRTAQVGMAGLAVGAGLVTRQFIQFDDAIFGASAKFGDLDITSKKGIKTMEQLRATARKVGADTKFNAVEAAQGLDFLAMASFNTEQAMVSLPEVTNLATVAQVDLARATDIASDTLGAFNLMSKDSAQLQLNLARVNDVAAKTTTMFNTTLEGLFDAVSKGGAQFTASGQKIETFSTLVGVMANASVKGSESGTQLRNIMLRLAGPTNKARAMMQKLGIRVQDSQGNFRDIISILDDVKKGTQKMGDVQRSAALNTIFGARAITGVNILLSAGTKKLTEYRKKLLASKGAAAAMAKIIEQGFGNQLKALGSAATEAGFKIITAFAGDGKKGIQVLTEAIRNFDPTPIVDGMKMAFRFVKAFIDIVKFLAPVIIPIVILWKSYAAAVAIATTAQALFNVTVSANPIAAVIVGVVALTAALVTLRANWNLVSLTWKIKANEISQSIVLLEIRLQKFLSNIPGIGKLFKSSLSDARGEMFKLVKEANAFKGIKTQIQTGKMSDEGIGGLLNKKEDQDFLRTIKPQAGPFAPADFSSPESLGITNTNNNNTSAALDVNFNNTPAGTSVKQSGQMPPGTTLNTGMDNG